MEGIIYVRAYMERARDSLEGTKVPKGYSGKVQDHSLSNALYWWRTSKTDADRQRTLELLGDVLAVYWERQGYSQKWIDKQLQRQILVVDNKLDI